MKAEGDLCEGGAIMAGSEELLAAFNGSNAAFIRQMYVKWAKDPKSVDLSFIELFSNLSEDTSLILDEDKGPSWAPCHTSRDDASRLDLLPDIDVSYVTETSVKALGLLFAFREQGHRMAQLNPLNLRRDIPIIPQLEPTAYGLGKDKRNDRVFLGSYGEDLTGSEICSVEQFLDALRRRYNGTIGLEFSHVLEPNQYEWLRLQLERGALYRKFSPGYRKILLHDLILAEGFEAFCRKRYGGIKRFGLEGGEALIPALRSAIRLLSRKGAETVTIGMAHRGRINVLANVIGKPLPAIFHEFSGGSYKPDSIAGAGDVKYHLGWCGQMIVDNRVVHLSLLPNPSHLEAVNTVVTGVVRALQDRLGEDRRKHIGILIHGDAAFSGQGVVYETLQMSRLQGFGTRGTIHIVLNNQIGFTATQQEEFSGQYCSDLGLAIHAPIVHVNGDDLEAVVSCFEMAADYRQEFGEDIIIDLTCYRRFGHNELDEPAFTQPIMSEVIKHHPTVLDLYTTKLLDQGLVKESDVSAESTKVQSIMEEAFQKSNMFRPVFETWQGYGVWKNFIKPGSLLTKQELSKTGVERDVLTKIGSSIYQVPETFHLHTKIAKQFEAKQLMLVTGKNLDWSIGEALAFGTLLLEKHPIRLTGQDVQRGTFSHRHAVLNDQTGVGYYVPLNHITDNQEHIEIYNSFLSEYGVLGFEYGYSLASPDSLIVWEAQFGDFANNAQIIIDQMLSAAESKWLQLSGLVLLLPHGYEGQAAEHSSARLERFLQLCAEENIQVCNLTTPANYFHVLRRQLVSPCRKPLIIMSPKSLLRHKLAVSELDDFVTGTMFAAVLPEIDKIKEDKFIKRVVFCSGKVYYDLLASRRKNSADDIALIRIEELYPLPVKEIERELARYPIADVVWCQEEPENMGAWVYISRKLEELSTKGRRRKGKVFYVGRPAAASPAIGLSRLHEEEQQRLVQQALEFV